MNHARRSLPRSLPRLRPPLRVVRTRTKTTTTTPQPAKNDQPIKYENQPAEPWKQSILTPYLRKSPFLLKTATLIWQGFGLYKNQANAVRSAKFWYMECCERDIAETRFLYEECGIPQTFHSWFQITNLHIWLLTVRFRALPPPHGKLFIQSLIDFFFQDISDRLHALLGPRTSSRAITGYMKEYRELWNGSQVALDIGLVGGDWELSAAVWRNVFDAKGWDLGGKRGEDGLLIPASSDQQLKPDDKSLEKLPHQLYLFTAYLRIELKRLEDITDEELFRDSKVGGFGKVGEPGDDAVMTSAVTKAELERWRKYEWPRFEAEQSDEEGPSTP